ncbi:hypothetical protein WS72_11200 [Burkholderia savannae]|uniref:Uncharacterized protein n=1 Tax=Burkholderia savannae TaxID=1637837 RepID=A0ABR5TEE3_9BURK|nr:hypothetical protein WS72_11200 [Burkholderia savannae]
MASAPDTAKLRPVRARMRNGRSVTPLTRPTAPHLDASHAGARRIPAPRRSNRGRTRTGKPTMRDRAARA